MLLGQAGPYERQKVDLAAAKRGSAVYTQNCINCHGAAARGTETAPDLIRSPLVLVRGSLGQRTGSGARRLVGHNAALTSDQVLDLTHFLKQQLEATARNRNPAAPPNVLTGDAQLGRAYFEGAGGCAKCHSATGDLAGVGRRYEPMDLQQRFLFPRSMKPVRATVTSASGPAVTGEVVKIDDFDVSVTDSAGQYHAWTRGPNLRVDIDDPLRQHHEMLDHYTDQDIHNIVRYLRRSNEAAADFHYRDGCFGQALPIRPNCCSLRPIPGQLITATTPAAASVR
jgi:mono/diheme cytochrome c family protein